jgi:hypothetical protein
MMPTSDLSLVHMDPDFPLPYAGDGILLTDFPEAAIVAVVEAFVGSPLLHVEVRHLGGAAALGSPDHGALNRVEHPFITFTFGLATDPEMKAAAEHHVELLLGTLGPWDSGMRYLNFAESALDARKIFPAESYDRLRQIKATYDPADMFQANHPVLRTG